MSGLAQILLFLAYAVGAFLTFGHTVNHDDGCTVIHTSSKFERGGSAITVVKKTCFPPIAAGIAWPIYWGGIAAIEVTK